MHEAHAHFSPSITGMLAGEVRSFAMAAPSVWEYPEAQGRGQLGTQLELDRRNGQSPGSAKIVRTVVYKRREELRMKLERRGGVYL